MHFITCQERLLMNLTYFLQDAGKLKYLVGSFTPISKLENVAATTICSVCNNRNIIKLKSSLIVRKLKININKYFLVNFTVLNTVIPLAVGI